VVHTRLQLEELVAQGEGVHLEFMLKPTTRIIEALVAMANTDGGAVVVGVSEKGDISGLERDEGANLVGRLPGWLAERVAPPLSAQIDTVELGQERVAVVAEVLPSVPPHMLFDGRVLSRVGTTTRPMSPSQILTQARHQGILPPYDARPVVGTKLSDLAPERVATFINAVNPDAAHDPQAVLRSFSLVVAPVWTPGAPELVPSLAGLLVLGHDPQQFLPHALIRVVRHSGSTLQSPVSDVHDIGGPLPKQAEEIQRLLARFFRTAATIQGLTRHETHEYPPSVVYELVINALVHRDYTSGTGPVLARVFSDRLEVSNPGTVEANSFEELAKLPPTLTNPTIVRALRALGFAESLGLGLTRAATELRASGHGVPLLEHRGNNVVFIVYTAREVADLSEATRDEDRLLERVIAQRVITKRDVRNLLGVSDATATRRLASLVERGLLARHSRGRGVYYTYAGVQRMV
jgi:ATP-dependent DNA helicase RecG